MRSPARVLTVDDNATKRDIVNPTAPRVRKILPQLILEPYRFACANRVTRLTMTALKTVHTKSQSGPRWRHGCPRSLPGAPQIAGRKHRPAHRAYADHPTALGFGHRQA